MQKPTQQQTLDLIILAYYSNPEKFKKEFEKHGIEITGEADIINLTNLSVTGNDECSVCAYTSQPAGFNVLEIIKNIQLTKAEINKGKIALKYFKNLKKQNENGKNIEQ